MSPIKTTPSYFCKECAVQIGYFHASNGMQCEGCLGPVVAELPAKDSLLSSLAVFSGKQKDIAELERMMKL